MTMHAACGVGTCQHDSDPVALPKAPARTTAPAGCNCEGTLVKTSEPTDVQLTDADSMLLNDAIARFGKDRNLGMGALTSPYAALGVPGFEKVDFRDGNAFDAAYFDGLIGESTRAGRNPALYARGWAVGRAFQAATGQ